MNTFDVPRQEGLTITAQPVEMPEDEEKRFVGLVVAGIRRALRDREPLEEQWKAAVAQYMARTPREDATERDSQLDFTQSYELAEQFIARMANPPLGFRQVFAARERRPQHYDFAKEAEDFSDWITDRQRFLEMEIELLRASCVYGSGWVSIDWSYKERMVRTWSEEEQLLPDGTVTLVRVEVEQPLVECVGCFPKVEYTPNIIFPMESGEDPEEAPWIAKMYREWPSKVKAKIGQGHYRSDIKVSDLGGSGGLRPDPALYLTTLDSDPGEGDTTQTPITLHQVYIPHPESGVETIMWIDLESEQVLNWVYNWYHEHQRGLRYFPFRKMIGELGGVSLMFILEPMHRAYTGILNQLLDSGSRANEKLIVAMKSLGLGEYFKDHRNRTGFYEAKGAVDASELNNGIREISLTQGFSNLQWILEVLMQHMQRAASITAALFGQETAQRPTALGTELVIGESKQPLSLMLERWLRFLSEVHGVQFSRYRQFFPDGVDYYVRSRQDGGELLTMQMRWPDGLWRDQIYFETTVSSEHMSKQVRKQEFVQMLQTLPDVIDRMLQLLSAATAASPVSIVAAQFAQVYLTLVLRAFEEFGVPGAEEMSVEGANIAAMAGQQYAQVIQELQGQVEMLQQQLQSVVSGGFAGSSAGPVGRASAGRPEIRAGVA